MVSIVYGYYVMHKSTVLFAVLAIFFAGTTIGVSVALLREQGASRPLVGGASIDFGIPGLGGGGERTLFRAASAVLWDSQAATVRFEQNGFERRPIASITKLMTAMVALDHAPAWDQTATIELAEYGPGGNLLLHPGEHVTIRDLFHTSLISSANNTTRAYVRAMGIPEEEFVRAMNRKAVELGLEQTEFTDVTGLDAGNISTAYEVARIAEAAFRDYPEIARISSLPEYTFRVGGSDREHTIHNSNKLITQQGEAVSGSKTGYIYAAGYCLVMRGAGETEGRIAVVLGSPSEAENLADTWRLLHLTGP